MEDIHIAYSCLEGSILQQKIPSGVLPSISIYFVFIFLSSHDFSTFRPVTLSWHHFLLFSLYAHCAFVLYLEVFLESFRLFRCETFQWIFLWLQRLKMQYNCSGSFVSVGNHWQIGSVWNFLGWQTSLSNFHLISVSRIWPFGLKWLSWISHCPQILPALSWSIYQTFLQDYYFWCSFHDLLSQEYLAVFLKPQAESSDGL